MKKIFSLLPLCLLMVSVVFAQNKKPVEKPAYIEFEETVYDFGQIPEGEKAECEFKFVNTSGKTLLLNPPKATCGCTTPFYPKEPLEAGAENVIKVKYSTKKKGKFHKQVRISAQDHDEIIVLSVKGEVIPKEAVSTVPSKKSNSLFKK